MFWTKVFGVLVAMLAGSVGNIVGRVLVALGVAVVTFYGAGELREVVAGLVDDMFADTAAYPTLVQFLGLLKFDVCIDMLVAAWGVRLMFMGMSAGGAISRLTHRFAVS